MIDTELIGKAKKKSGLIEQIDASWREFTEGLKEGIFTVPLPAVTAAWLRKMICLLRAIPVYCL